MNIWWFSFRCTDVSQLRPNFKLHVSGHQVSFENTSSLLTQEHPKTYIFKQVSSFQLKEPLLSTREHFSSTASCVANELVAFPVLTGQRDRALLGEEDDETRE